LSIATKQNLIKKAEQMIEKTYINQRIHL